MVVAQSPATEEMSESAGGLRIFRRSWKPSSAPHGVVSSVMLQFAQRPVSPGGRAFFEALHKDFKVSAMPSEMLGETEVYVLDAQAQKPMGDLRMSKMRFYFAQDSGVILKVAVWNEQGVLLGTITTHNVKLNIPISEERFKYRPPQTTNATTSGGFSLPSLPFSFGN